MCLDCKPLLEAIDAYIRKADDSLADALGEEGYIEPQRTLDYIQEIEDGAAEVLLEETDYVLSEVEKAVDLETFGADIWPEVKLNDSAKSKLATVFKETFSEFLPEYIDYYIAQTDRELKLEQVSKRTLAWVKSWSKELGAIMQLNSHKEIERILRKGIQAGTGIAEFTRAIRESGIRDEYYKARRVAVTEVLRAHSVAQQEAYMQSPAVTEKMWKHTGAYRNEPRQNHVDMNGQRVPVDKPFELIGVRGGTYAPMYPRDTILPPEETINCHCIAQPVVDESILGLSLEERQRLQQEAVDSMDDAWERELDARNRAKAGIEEEPLTSPPEDDTINSNRENLVSAIKSRFEAQLTEPQQAEFGVILDSMTDDQLALYEKMSQNHASNLYHETGRGAMYRHSTKMVIMDIDNAKWEQFAQTGQTAAWRTKFHEESHQLDHILAEMGIDFSDPKGQPLTGIHAITDTSTTIGKELIKAIKDDIVTVVNKAVEDRNSLRRSLDLDPCLKPITSLNRIPLDTKRSLIFWLRDNYRTDKDRAMIASFTDAVGLATDGKITLQKEGFWGHKLQYNKDRDGNGATSETFANFGAMFFRNDEEQIAAMKQLMPKTYEAYSDLFSKIMEMVLNGSDILYP